MCLHLEATPDAPPRFHVRASSPALALPRLLPAACVETDAGSARDIPNYLGQSPHELVRRDEDEREFRFLIRRGEEESD